MMCKKIVTITIILILAFSLCIPAMATPAEDVKNELDALRRAYPNNSDLSKAVDDAKNWLSDSTNASTITASAAAAVKSEISKATATVGSATKLSDLNQSQINSIIGNITTAARAAGLQIQVASNGVITILDSDGNPITGTRNANDIIKQTGVSPSFIGIIAVCLFITILIAFVMLVYLPRNRAAKRIDKIDKRTKK